RAEGVSVFFSQADYSQTLTVFIALMASARLRQGHAARADDGHILLDRALVDHLVPVIRATDDDIFGIGKRWQRSGDGHRARQCDLDLHSPLREEECLKSNRIKYDNWSLIWGFVDFMNSIVGLSVLNDSSNFTLRRDGASECCLIG